VCVKERLEREGVGEEEEEGAKNRFLKTVIISSYPSDS